MLTQLLMTAKVWIGPTPSALLRARLTALSKFVGSLKHVMLRYREG
jgi:hypothetical protein